MAGHHPFARLTEELSPAGRARKGDLRAAMLLHELRQARAMTRKSVGEEMDVNQPAVAKLERRADMYVSNLRSCIEAMGGRLDIAARFPQGSVVIGNFSDAAADRRSRASVCDRSPQTTTGRQRPLVRSTPYF